MRRFFRDAGKKFTVLGTLLACTEETFKDVSDAPEFKIAVGATYEVVGAVDAYGIRRHSGAAVEYITLIPPPGIEGSEVGFRVSVNSGSRIIVLKVLKTNRWIDRDLSFVVKLEGTNMKSDVVTRIDLFRGNEGQGFLQLNPRIYRKMSVD